MSDLSVSTQQGPTVLTGGCAARRADCSGRPPTKGPTMNTHSPHRQRRSLVTHRAPASPSAPRVLTTIGSPRLPPTRRPRPAVHVRGERLRHRGHVPARGRPPLGAARRSSGIGVHQGGAGLDRTTRRPAPTQNPQVQPGRAHRATTRYHDRPVNAGVRSLSEHRHRRTSATTGSGSRSAASVATRPRTRRSRRAAGRFDVLVLRDRGDRVGRPDLLPTTCRTSSTVRSTRSSTSSGRVSRSRCRARRPADR